MPISVFFQSRYEDLPGKKAVDVLGFVTRVPCEQFDPTTPPFTN